MTYQKGRWYRSKFALPDGRPSFSEFWARDINEARGIAANRGFDPPAPYSGLKLKEFRPSRLAKALGHRSPHVLHSLCYLAFLAGRSGVVTAPSRLVEDGSALHELAHALINPRLKGGKVVEIAIAAMEALEASTPGVPPPEIEMVISYGFIRIEGEV